MDIKKDIKSIKPIENNWHWNRKELEKLKNNLENNYKKTKIKQIQVLIIILEFMLKTKNPTKQQLIELKNKANESIQNLKMSIDNILQETHSGIAEQNSSNTGLFKKIAAFTIAALAAFNIYSKDVKADYAWVINPQTKQRELKMVQGGYVLDEDKKGKLRLGHINGQEVVYQNKERLHIYRPNEQKPDNNIQEPETVEEYIEMAKKLYITDKKASIEILEAAKKKFPKSSSIYVYLGNLYIVTKNYQKSADAFTTAQKWIPTKNQFDHLIPYFKSKGITFRPNL